MVSSCCEGCVKGVKFLRSDSSGDSSLLIAGRTVLWKNDGRVVVWEFCDYSSFIAVAN